MSVGDRSKTIRANVANRLRDPSGLNTAQTEIVYDAVNRVQRRIAEEVACLEETYDIILTSGQEMYSLPSDFIRERSVIPLSTPTGSIAPLSKINLDDLGRLKGSHSGTDPDTLIGFPSAFYYYLWRGEIGFTDSNGVAVSSSQTMRLYYWRGPEPVADTISDSIDPVLEPRWDTAMFYGAMADLTTEDRWEQKFEREKERQKVVEDANQMQVLNVPPTRAYD